MNAHTFRHVAVSELPEDWREQLGLAPDEHVTVRVEREAVSKRREIDWEKLEPKIKEFARLVKEIDPSAHSLDHGEMFYDEDGLPK